MSASFLSGPAMAPNDDSQGAAAGVIREAMPQIMAATCVITFTTCVGMWTTLRLIEQSINSVVANDAAQTIKIETLQNNVSSMRIELGILRGRVADTSRRFGP